MLFLMRILQFNQMKRILKDNYYMDSVWQKMEKNYKLLIKQKKPLKFLKKLRYSKRNTYLYLSSQKVNLIFTIRIRKIRKTIEC